jgi:hypothetical protein
MPTIAEQLQADHLRRNLARVQAGIRTRAAGIHHCRDCRQPFIATTTSHPWCPDCRSKHSLICGRCETPYPVDEDPSGLCPTHRAHPTLWEEEPT